MAVLPVQVKAFVIGTLLVSMGTVNGEWDDTHKIMIYYMTDICGTTVNLWEKPLHEAIIQLSNAETYGNFMDCDLTIVTSDGQQLMFSFLDVNLDSCADSVQLFSETTNPSDALTTQLCTSYNSIHETPGKTGILKFKSDSIGNQGSVKVQITSFSPTVNGECSSNYFNCNTQGRCINGDLKCNDRDNCGNNADEGVCSSGNDEDEEDYTWIYTRVLPGVISVVVGVTVVTIVSCVLLHKKKRGMVGAPCPGQSRYPPVPPPAYQNPAYSQAYSSTANNPNQSWFTATTPSTGLSTTGPTVDPPLAAFSYSQQTYNTLPEKKI